MYSDLSFGADAPRAYKVTQAAMDQQFFGFGGTIMQSLFYCLPFRRFWGTTSMHRSNLSFIVDNKTTTFVFRAVVVVMTAVGAVLNVQLVWTLADLFMALIAIINNDEL